MSRAENFSKATAGMAKTFMYRGFDPEEYARSLSAQSDGDKGKIISYFQFNWEYC